MQLKQQGAEFQKETSSLLLTWISWQPTLETSFDVGRCCFQREACIRLLMAFIYALLLIEFRFLCFLLLLFCSFLTACFSVKLMNISVESFSWLFHGNCCRRCSLPGSARLLLSGSKERPSVGGRWSWRNWCPVGSWQGERQQEVTRPK